MSAIVADPMAEPLDAEICLLRERLEHLFRLAEWAHRQWYAPHGRDVDYVVDRLVGRLNSASLPIAWVAVAGDEPAGMVSVVRQRSPDGRVVPCLAELFVTPEHRRRGLGRRLCDRAIEFARESHHPALYLYCAPDETYYHKRGWLPAWTEVVRRDNREALFLGKSL